MESVEFEAIMINVMAIQMHEKVLVEVNITMEDPLQSKSVINYGFEDPFVHGYQRLNFLVMGNLDLLMQNCKSIIKRSLS